ncbi:MAG: hypothetical protein KGD58_09435 [Candidatus Lokiarchaeota archaeon]|nr:hypothetical protein [Candidatus Lokiarchaeota archaeon]
MNHKKIILFCSLFFLLVPIVNVDAFIHFDYIKDGNYQFFLFDLQTGNNTQISVNHDESGNFTLFLFNKRPVKSYVNADKTLSENIFLNPSLVDFSLADNPYINYTSPETKIYYIEIILVGGGPDAYNLTILPSGYTVTRYYLPIIPGFRLEFILISLISAIGISILLFRKRLTR